MPNEFNRLFEAADRLALLTEPLLTLEDVYTEIRAVRASRGSSPRA